MARTFASGSSEYCKYAGSVGEGYPFAMAAWFKPANLTQAMSFFSVCNTGAYNSHGLHLAGDVAGDYLLALSVSVGIGKYAVSSSMSSGTWQHALGVFIANNDRDIYYNGGSKGSNSDLANVTGVNSACAGCLYFTSGTANLTSGSVAECSIWNLSGYSGATASDKADTFTTLALAGLAAGKSALYYPLGLIGYWPFGELYDPSNNDLDIIGGCDMTAFNTPTTDTHPSITYPARMPLLYNSLAGGVRLLSGGLAG